MAAGILHDNILALAGLPKGCVVPVAVRYVNQDGQMRENLIYFNPGKITRDTKKWDLEEQLKNIIQEMLGDSVVSWDGLQKFYIDHAMLDARLVINR